MKRLLYLMAFLPFSVFSAPHVVSDVLQTGVSQCGVFLDANAKVTSPVVPAPSPAVGNICSFDVSTVIPGSHTISMTAILNDPVWGSQESAKSTPLTFTRPTPPAVPTGLNLQP